MVHKNYKWNISKEKGGRMVFNTIECILKERKDNSIHIDELYFLISNRTKHTTITNNNKKKNIHNFIKVVYGGLVHFLDNYDDFMLRRVNDGYIVELNNRVINDWILVENI
tara:strand:+ start:1681 stop:2013 length:333 start_codon:yes stop_codon:yes gene_type:complete